jgi:hypothetical protein
MSIAVSPRLWPTSLSRRPSLMTATLASVGPPFGASRFTYLATVALLVFQPSLPLLAPAGSTNSPVTLPSAHRISNCAPMVAGSRALPLVMRPSSPT